MKEIFKCSEWDILWFDALKPLINLTLGSQSQLYSVKHLDSIMVWGAFSREMGRAGLYFLPKNKKMKSDQYVKVLEEHMLSMFHIHSCEVFMQDNAPCHKSKKFTHFLNSKK